LCDEQGAKVSLPAGWKLSTVREVIEGYQPGFASGQKDVEGGVCHLRMNNVGVRGEMVLDLVRRVPQSLVTPKYKLQSGDVLVCTTNSGKLVGKSTVFALPGQYVFSNHLTRLRPRREVVDGSFLVWNLWLQWQRGAFEDKCKHWVNQSSLPKDALLETEVMLPPVSEQRRIVATLDKVITRINVSRNRLDHVKGLLNRFRQAVLAEACDGNLTADWRAHNESQCEPVLPQAPKSPLRNSRRGANLSGPTALLIEEMPALPHSWRYVRQDWLVSPGTVVCYGIVLPGPEVSGGVPYVRQQDIRDGRVHLGELRHTTRAIAARHGRSSLAQGDVLLCIIRNLRVAIVPRELEGANITQGTVRIRPDRRYISSQYLAAYLASPPAQAWMRTRYFGMDMPRINVEDARALPVALPPMAEQQEIGRRLERLLGFADTIEARLNDASYAVENLTRSLVAKAFRGELVPTAAALAVGEGRPYETPGAVLEGALADRTHIGDPQEASSRSRIRGPSEPAAVESRSARVPRRRTA
jgi:type I restriction enzyme, S subunit